MIEFDITLSPAEAKTLQDRVVEQVTEYRTTHPLFGKMASWRGAVALEYFSIVFVRGVLVVSVVERECQLGHIASNYATTKTLTKALDAMDTDEKKLSAQEIYNNTVSDSEQNEITFDDILAILDWRYAQFAKYDRDVLMD